MPKKNIFSVYLTVFGANKRDFYVLISQLENSCTNFDQVLAVRPIWVPLFIRERQKLAFTVLGTNLCVPRPLEVKGKVIRGVGRGGR
jgi:hypothetical protein